MGNADTASLAGIIRRYDGPPLRIMEVCGTHTHETFKAGIRQILPDGIKLTAGPGCPVCVTPPSFIDEAVFLADRHDLTICTFGDLVKVPGSEESLSDIRARGADLKIVYSPLDALEFAKTSPDREVVFLSVGFETTVPASCLAAKKAKEAGVGNFSMLCANKTMDNAYRLLAGSADAFLYPGHVSAITGTGLYAALKDEGVSGVVAGFTPGEILAALAVISVRAARGEPFFVNCYTRVVTDEGSPEARRLISQTMEVSDAEWRGLGKVKNSGLKLNAGYAGYDTRLKFGIPALKGRENPGCRCGDVLRGECEPHECPLFGKSCDPDSPVGACMVSSEGACSAYYKYGGRKWKD